MEFFRRLKQLYSLNNLGEGSFFLGILFLPSALPISAIFILISLIVSFLISQRPYLKNKWNYFILVSISLITFSCIRNSLDSALNETFSRDPSLIWLDLFNWFPLFLLFWSSQIYTDNEIKRKNCARIFLISTLPVFVSCIGQYWLGWQGPISTLNGLIVWFMMPISETQNLTGLFSNSNYLGCWLSVLFPFAAVSLSYKKNDLKKFCIILLNLFFIYLILLTSSRNALASIFLSLGMLKIKFIFLFILFLIFTPFIIFNLFPKLFFDFGESFLPINLIKRFSITIRLEIWNKTLSLIGERPLWGWGGGIFPVLYLAINGYYAAQHSHNLPLHLATTYGIPLAISLVGLVSLIIFKSYKVIFQDIDRVSNNLNKAWFISTLIMIFWHFSDITYFDGKISIIAWILLGGLCSIIRENETKQKSTY
tara:strand:+ start:3576 stop:4847 length:1272 start_codon:yes stop_codon:yes gene_type:complete